MKKNEKIALFIALLTFIISMLNPFEKKNENSEDLIKVISAFEKIEDRSKISKEMLVEKEILSSMKPKNAIGDMDEIVGSYSNATIYPGDILTSEKIASKGTVEAGLAAIIPENKRAISINIEQASGLSSLLNPGDFIDIISTLEEDHIKKSLIVTQNNKVLAIDNKLKAPTAEESVPYTTVTIAASLEEVLKINLVENKGSPLKLILRSRGDKENISLESFSYNILLQQ